ncbi:MAG TPA: BlaI/MecI/CopY family transcriptional regulator [Pirellulales bacterium]|nr:BlaI/MecI/CopY family transcriptional regulator [Pirellulales bacterium]
MLPKPQSVTDAELGVMKLIWSSEPVSAGVIRKQLYPEGSPSDHATVQKLLQRLESKGVIERDRSTWPHTFRALVSSYELAGQQLDALAEKLTDGSLVPFLLHAVGKQRLSAKERAEILALLQRPKRST